MQRNLFDSYLCQPDASERKIDFMRKTDRERGRLSVAVKSDNRVDTFKDLNLYIYDSTSAVAAVAALVAVNAIGTDTVTAPRSAKK